MASQLLIAGLMLAMKRRGFGVDLFNEAFEYAADVSIASTYSLGSTDLGQSARVLEMVDSVRKEIVGS